MADGAEVQGSPEKGKVEEKAGASADEEDDMAAKKKGAEVV